MAALAKLPRDHENTLLKSASICLLYQRAGAMAKAFEGSLPEAAPAEERDYCSKRAASLLQQTLVKQRAKYLPEWLKLASEAGLIVPPEKLPALLAKSSQKPALTKQVLQVIGKRGLWLCQQNKSWAHLLEPEKELDLSIWQEGVKEQRLTLLRTLRAANPAKGRELVEATWQEESARDRADFLSCFQEGLSDDDCLFLESAQKDRAKSVREWAIRLLRQIPSSLLVSTIRERALSLLKGERKKSFIGLLGETITISVTLPKELDDELKALGLEESPPKKSTLGKRAWLLKQMIGAVPPKYWTQSLHMTAEEAVTAATHTEHPMALLLGWKEATESFQNSQWAQALCSRFLIDSPDLVSNKLISALPRACREKIVRERLEEEKGRGDDNYGATVSYCRYPWSKEFTLQVLRYFLVNTRWRTGYWPAINYRQLFAPTVKWWFPDAYEEINDLFSKRETDSHISGVHSFLDLLAEYEFRHEMHKELKK